jgi:hypothetical protein
VSRFRFPRFRFPVIVSRYFPAFSRRAGGTGDRDETMDETDCLTDWRFRVVITNCVDTSAT